MLSRVTFGVSVTTPCQCTLLLLRAWHRRQSLKTKRRTSNQNSCARVESGVSSRGRSRCESPRMSMIPIRLKFNLKEGKGREPESRWNDSEVMGGYRLSLVATSSQFKWVASTPHGGIGIVDRRLLALVLNLACAERRMHSDKSNATYIGPLALE